MYVYQILKIGYVPMAGILLIQRSTECRIVAKTAETFTSERFHSQTAAPFGAKQQNGP